MRVPRTCGPLVVAAVVISALGGCSSSEGVRKLESFERDYYAALESELAASSRRLETVLATTGEVENGARYEVALLTEGMDAAKTVYSVREVLTAPKGDRQPFVQKTRNAIIMYYLLGQSVADAAALDRQAAADAARRRALLASFRDLATLVRKVQASEEQIHAYLNQSATANVRGVVAEVGRQIDAFHERIKTEDQKNAFVKSLTDVSASAADVSEKSQERLDRFLEVWQKLNKE